MPELIEFAHFFVVSISEANFAKVIHRLDYKRGAVFSLNNSNT